MFDRRNGDDKWMIDSSDAMSEAELRQLFKVMRETNPQALRKALDVLHGNDETTTTTSTTTVVMENDKKTETDVETDTETCGKKKKPKKLSFGRIFKKKKDKDDGHLKSTVREETKSQPQSEPDPAHQSEKENDVDPKTEEKSPTPEEKNPPAYVPGEVPGCYLVYDSGSSGRLMLYYSEDFVPESVGFWSPGPGHTIQKFKFSRDSGRSILIGNCASGVQGRHNYYSGWCQFFRQARQMEGSLTVFIHNEGRGLPVDMYAFYLQSEKASNVTAPIQENVPFPTAGTDAVCCLPKHSTIFDELASHRMDNWITTTNTRGAATGFYENNTSSGGGGDTANPPTRLPPVTPTNSSPDDRVAASPSPSPSSSPDVGCYLVYDRDGARLMAHYSRTPVSVAVGFWRPGPDKSIQPFKFKQNLGRSVVQSDCASGVSGRRNYYSGWCQFVRSARASDGLVTLFPRRTDDPDCPQQHGLDVDLYVYRENPLPGTTQTQRVPEDGAFDTNGMTAVACLPRRADFFEDNVSVSLEFWMTTANATGVASRFDVQC